MIYLWLKYCRLETFERIQDTNDTSIALMAKLGSKALSKALMKMELEFPILLYSYQFNSKLDTNQDCLNFYIANFLLSRRISNLLCGTNNQGNEVSQNITVFSFKDPLLTCRAWVNIYFNNDTHD